jgi:hypothetical protein
MRSRHQFVWTAAIINKCTGVAIITVQSLVAPCKMILRAYYPYNHVIAPISRGDKRRAATATVPGHIPTAGDGRRIGRSNAESREDGVAIVVGAERDISAMISTIGDCCLEDSAAGNLG